MPITVKQIQEISDAMTDEEKAKILEDFRQSIEQLNTMVEDLAREGKGIEWNGQAWAIVDSPGINSRFQEQGRKPPEIANVFSEGRIEVPTSQPFHAFSAAVIAGREAWKEIPSMLEHEVIVGYEHRKPGGTTVVQLRADTNGRSRSVALSELFNQAGQLSDLHSDLFLAMVAQLLHGQKDAAGNTWITSTRLLDYRGIKPIMKGHWRSGHRQEDIEEIAQAIRSMETTWIKLDEVEIIDSQPPGSRKRAKRSRYSHESRLFMFGDIIYHQEMPLDGTLGKKYPVAWQYRESTWMLPFLEGPNRFTAPLLRGILAYDPYRQTWEKRLAKHFLWWFRANRQKGIPSIRIQTLFDECHLPIDKRNPQRTRDRFEEAMNRLHADGHLSAWEYEEEARLPARGWLTTWLCSSIAVSPPEEHHLLP